MGFRKPNFNQAETALRGILGEILSPYNDGFTSSYCKHDLYMLKCWLEDEYSKLPTFAGEEKWEQERLIEVLKK
jgi:hypothetical protein